MAKKVISAKTLAALYPSNKWKTRAIIQRATTGAQDAYNNEMIRLQSIQKTYQSVMKFGKAAIKGYGSFEKARLAGFKGKMLDYAKLGAEGQGKLQDDYKVYNKQVMEATNNQETLSSLYENYGKKITGGKTTKSIFGQKVATEEVAATDEKSMLARKIREGVAPRKNPDGTESTVLMVTQESDGKFYAHPSLFPDGKGGWIQFGKSKEDMDKAWNMAKDKGELFEFDDEGEAENFAKGSWKSKGTGLDVILDAYSDIKSGKTPPKPPELKEKDKEYDWSFLPPDPEKFKEADWEYSPPATADEWSKSVHESHKYWENQQKMWEQAMPDFADTFNLVENAGDRLEFMDRMMKLKPDERMELLKSVESSATSKEEKRALLDKYGIDERYWDYSNLDKVIVREKERRRGGLLGLKKEKYLQRTSPEEEMEDWDRNIRVLISKQEEELGRELSNEERKSLIEEVYSGRNMEEPPSVYASDDYIHELSRRKELMERLGIDEKYTGMFEHEVNKIDISELIKKAYTPSGLWRMGKGYGQWIIPGGKGKHDVKGFYPEDRGQLRFKEAYRGIETDITGAKTLGDVDPRTGSPYPVGTAATPRKRLGYEDWLEELYGKYYDPGI